MGTGAVGGGRTEHVRGRAAGQRIGGRSRRGRPGHRRASREGIGQRRGAADPGSARHGRLRAPVGPGVHAGPDRGTEVLRRGGPGTEARRQGVETAARRGGVRGVGGNVAPVHRAGVEGGTVFGGQGPLGGGEGLTALEGVARRGRTRRPGTRPQRVLVPRRRSGGRLGGGRERLSGGGRRRSFGAGVRGDGAGGGLRRRGRGGALPQSGQHRQVRGGVRGGRGHLRGGGGTRLVGEGVVVVTVVVSVVQPVIDVRGLAFVPAP